jgi:quercetin dioxygenase-like cupin family protein
MEDPAMTEPLGDVATRLLFENETVKVWEMTLAPGEASALHRHDHPYVMCVLEGSRIDADIVGKGRLQIPVQPGSVLFVPPGETERAMNATDGPFREILIELKTAPGDATTEVAVANLPGPPTLTPSR